MSMNQNTKDFISSLKQYNEKNLSKDIFIPSMEKSVKFNPLTTKHQRYIIESTIDNPIINSTFNQKILEIIKELAHEDISQSITSFDKDAILIQMRYNFIDETYKDADMSEVIEYIKGIKEDFTPKQIKKDGVIIDLTTPLYSDEVKLITEFEKKTKHNMVPENKDQVGSILSDMYVLELIKFISSITIEGSGTSFDFRNSSIIEKISIIDILTKKVNKDIQDHITSVKEDHQGMYKLNDDLTIEVSTELFT